MIGRYEKTKIVNKLFYLFLEIFMKGKKSPLLIKKNNIYKKVLISKFR